ncbi:MAG: septum formation inhibitor Maf [Peptococcaceae bacterium]|jgi:septum formation protein|nr:septum formation inhibitor Maf [Peptococcaceae bacterium]MBQ2021783.1 septum formation inhibitor Maf [Peptococcaceae bacterium]MBQ2370031.1 septum formation inhibitor Maf [Peptococcaceae bacterium]MBQ2432741.1 septum formation inhibitor Maf [Peptococcaceae bacterium]MBQ5368797.1 septum formation inhibitor Maf [Peptococcaceae bacterium]
MKLILASASPRRRELLTQVGVSFVIEVSDVEEVLDDTLSPELQVQSLALQKAQAVAAQHKDGLVLGADTVVVDAGSLLGKPQNTEEAAEMLRSLSGKWHQVMTAVALVDANDTKHEWTSVEITNVKFRDLTEDDIAAYVATGESMDKAGAYGIQGYGALLVERIEGCYNNVVGLPLQLVAKGLRNWGINLYEYKEVQTQ